MRWDEERFGRCYDLDQFNVVATHDFNMGAMENKGLNVFNAKYIVADATTATDDDFLHVEGVVAHEYFHNWTGNRVTLRDWFQLSLKEGLTVYRDQEFSADANSRALKRIDDVRTLRTLQFAEDAGAFAHPVRPDSYHEINNFYTATVYEKGAEIVRMLATVLGADGFRRGMDLYFERHDGQAVTCDELRQALADANGADLSGFARWYSQAGTPQVRATSEWDAATGRYSLLLSQRTPPTPGQPEKSPVPIPVRLTLYAPDGAPQALTLAGEDAPGPTGRIVLLDVAERRYEFTGLAARPVASLLQDFSAPVELHRDASSGELAFLAHHDRDPFNRWDAIQRLAEGVIARELEREGEGARGSAFAALGDALAALLDDDGADPAWVAECLSLPEEAYLAERLDQGDPARLHAAREALRAALGRRLGPRLTARHDRLHAEERNARDGAAIGRRRLKSLALSLLVAADPVAEAARARAQLARAGNMTDRLGALTVLVHAGCEGAQALAEDFHTVFRHDPLVVDKWLGLQATNPQSGTLERVRRLIEHAAFSWRNPNKVRALVGSFARANRMGFHAVDGAGYRFVAEAVLTLDRLNPQIAARLVSAFNGWRRLEPHRRALMRHELEGLSAQPALSGDVTEIVQRALA
jgi:aminopeptidase N